MSTANDPSFWMIFTISPFIIFDFMSESVEIPSCNEGTICDRSRLLMVPFDNPNGSSSSSNIIRRYNSQFTKMALTSSLSTCFFFVSSTEFMANM